MERAIRLVAVNLGLTVAAMVACLAVGSLAGTIVGGTRLSESRQGDCSSMIKIPGNREKGAAVRSGFQTYAARLGLIAAQRVFLVMHLEPRARAAAPDVPKPEGV